MKRKALLSIPLAALAILAVGAFAAPTVQAHDGVASGTCQGGVQWDYHNYDKTVVNSITVTIDGTVRYTDGDFKASDSGAIATDKTVAHTWDVAVNAPGTQYDKHPSGAYAACVVAPTTTVTPTTTVAATTTLPTTTTPLVGPSTTAPTSVEPTTSIVAVDIPPVPTLALIPPVIIAADASVQPALPVTGGGDEVAFIAIAAGLIAVGVYLVIRGRRVP